MKTEEIKLAELLCTRLCHELAGIVGALQGSVEMLQEGDNSKENVELLSDATTEIFNRLRLYRTVFGKENDEGLALAETRELIEKSGRNIHFDWPDQAWPGWQDQKRGRIVSLCFLVAYSILSQGGSIALLSDFTLDFKGKTRKLSDNSSDPRNSEWFLAQKLAAYQNLDLSLVLEAAGGKIKLNP